MSFWGYDEQHEEHEQAMYWHQVEVSHNSMKKREEMTMTFEQAKDRLIHQLDGYSDAEFSGGVCEEVKYVDSVTGDVERIHVTTDGKSPDEVVKEIDDARSALALRDGFGGHQ